MPAFVSREATLTPQGAGSLAAGLAGLPTRGESQPVRTRGSPKDGALLPFRRTSEATAEQLASNLLLHPAPAWTVPPVYGTATMRDHCCLLPGTVGSAVSATATLVAARMATHHVMLMAAGEF